MDDCDQNGDTSKINKSADGDNEVENEYENINLNNLNNLNKQNLSLKMRAENIDT